jgi:hypothetical protein
LAKVCVLFFSHDGGLVVRAMGIPYTLMLRLRLNHLVRNRPEAAAGYQRLFIGLIIFGSIPWLVMCVGMEVGGVSDVESYLRPPHQNLYIAAWYGIVIATWIFVLVWLLFLRGAEFLARHPGLLTTSENPTTIRFVFGIPVGGMHLMLLLYLWLARAAPH